MHRTRNRVDDLLPPTSPVAIFVHPFIPSAKMSTSFQGRRTGCLAFSFSSRRIFVAKRRFLRPANGMRMGEKRKRKGKGWVDDAGRRTTGQVRRGLPDWNRRGYSYKIATTR